jgi:hypothetical protein
MLESIASILPPSSFPSQNIFTRHNNVNIWHLAKQKQNCCGNIYVLMGQIYHKISKLNSTHT